LLIKNIFSYLQYRCNIYRDAFRGAIALQSGTLDRLSVRVSEWK